MAKIRELSPELLEIAMRELNEVPSRREADIAHIREWVHKQPHIMASPDDQMIIAFLRGCKFSLERTKEKIDTYYTMRTALPEFFKDRDVRNEELSKYLQLGPFIHMPGSDSKGQRLVLGREVKSDSDNDKHRLDQLCKLCTMMTDYAIRENDALVISGGDFVMDYSGLTLARAAQMSPSLMKKVMVLAQDAYPLRLKGIHFINYPSFFETAYNFVKTFAKEKMKNRIFIHGNKLESLHEHIPQELLPTEYGGTAGAIDEINDMWVKKITDYNEWYLAEAGQCVDESKRPGQPKTHQDLFGLEGSFRNLNVD